MKKILVYISAVFILGCTSKKQEAELSEQKEFFEVKLPNDLHVKKQLRLSAFADSVTYIPLQTAPECLISKIKGIKLFGKKLFILTDNKEIFTFSKSGKFLNKIGTRGKGPKEYYSVIDFAINDSSVFVLDYAKRIARYGDTGEFDTYLKLPKQASRIISLEDKNIACYIPDSQFNSEEKLYSWLIINYDGDSIGTIVTPRLRDVFGKEKYITNHFVLTNISCHYPFTFKEAFNDSLYNIDSSSKEIKAFACINQGIHKMNFKATFEQVVYAKHNMRINNIIDTPKYIFIYYACMCYGNNQTHYAVYDKSEELFYNLNDQNDEENIENNIDEGVNFRLLSCVEENQLVGFVDAYVVAESKKDLIAGVNIKNSDNPILVLARLKK
jgi:hypothetical protein